MFKIEIRNRYLYIFDNDNKQVAYFENFEGKKERKSVIALSSNDKNGDKFIKQNNNIIQNADIYWFSNKPLRYRIMFIKEKYGAFDYLILISPIIY